MVVNRYKKNAATITTITIFYVSAAVLFYDLRNANLPTMIQWFVEAFTLPLRYMFRPLYPLLRPFGWVVSDGADLPTPYGIVAGTAVWILFLIFVSYFFTAKPDKKRPYEEYWGG